MDFYIDIGLTVLLRAVKNKDRRRALKREFAKLVRSIITAYGDDPEFRELAGLTEGE